MTRAAELIREARKASGLTQGELAERARTKQSSISRLESGKVDPTTETLARLVEAAGWKLEMRIVRRGWRG
jgi:predicted transcriptional regulator